VTANTAEIAGEATALDVLADGEDRCQCSDTLVVAGDDIPCLMRATWFVRVRCPLTGPTWTIRACHSHARRLPTEGATCGRHHDPGWHQVEILSIGPWGNR